MTKYINTDEFLIDESEAYVNAQNLIADDATKLINKVVHMKIQQLITDAPWANVAEIVRCKDCVYYGGESLELCLLHTEPPSGTTRGHKFYCEPDGYCSYGERKDDVE